MFTAEDLHLYLKDLENLVSIDTPATNIEGIKKVTELLSKKVEGLDLKVTTHEYNKERAPCVLMTNAADGENIDVLMLAHLDTVYPKGTAASRPVSIKENRMMGPGVVDNKAGALSGVYILKHLDLSKVKVALLLNTNEEEGSLVNNIFIKDVAKRSMFTFGLEPARESGALVEKRFGVLNYDVSFTGKEATGIDFSTGASALIESANFIRNISSFSNPYKGNLLNVVILENSSKSYSKVDDFVKIGIQLRFIEESAPKAFLEKLEAAKSRSVVKNIEVKTEMKGFYPSMYITEKAKDFKKSIWKAGREAKVQIKYETSFGGSDCCFASEVGSSVIDGLGPIGGKLHTEGEYLEISSIQERCNLVINMINQVKEFQNVNFEEKAAEKKELLEKMRKERAERANKTKSSKGEDNEQQQ